MDRHARALVVGIDDYTAIPRLGGCANDAKAMAGLLARNSDNGKEVGSPNYDVKAWAGKTDRGADITRAALRKGLEELFRFDGDVLFHFSGHGFGDTNGGVLCTVDAVAGDLGIGMQELMTLAMASKARYILVILDCCHAGHAGNVPGAVTTSGFEFATLRDNMTVIAACGAPEQSMESRGHGVFTGALLDALAGGAADHMGQVTAPALYAYASRRFSGWNQRPVYRSNTSDVFTVRQCEPLIPRQKLHRMVELFKSQDDLLRLDPEYDFDQLDENGNIVGPCNMDKITVGLLLKDLRDAGLVRATIPLQQLYWAAKRSGTVELTPRGREYWWLVANNKI